jgi:hypothetical protein
MKDLETQFLEVEVTRMHKRELYHISVHHPCRVFRGKAGWDLYKAGQKQKALNRILIKNADVVVSSAELEHFLFSQSLTLS